MKEQKSERNEGAERELELYPPLTVQDLILVLRGEVPEGDDLQDLELGDAAEFAAHLIERIAKDHPDVIDLDNAEVF